MRAEALSMRRLRSAISAVGAAALTAGLSVQAHAADIVGQPVDGAVGLQPGYSSLKHEAIFFHNVILLPIITAITLFVLALLLVCIVRFNKRANPTPAKWSHNTTVEVLWTGLPVLILMFIAIFSFRLLFDYHTMPTPDLTVKATGYQWYWGYAYPDQKIDEYTSNVLPEADAKSRGEPYLLAADNALVVPVNKTVKVLVTGADVIHDFALPAFGLKTDAVPGRVNETWFKAEKTGIYYGQCDQLCGVNHAFMPIEIKVVTQPEFDAWVLSQHGTPTDGTAPAPAAAPAAPAAPASSSAPAAPQKVAMNAAVAQH
ncbi:MAG: cytochrome c oxidase subunit II [Caulobacteraceae bacterium]|nr:cytochrome c oxidase subunit II [Caulobacteraceae bacterium]